MNADLDLRVLQVASAALVVVGLLAAVRGVAWLLTEVTR